MGCATTPDGSTIFSGCGIKSCQFCGVCADYLCDFPLGGGATCSALVCRRHAIDQPHASIRLDYCPPHDAVEKAELWPTWTLRRDKALAGCLSQKLPGQRYAVFLKMEKNDRMDPDEYMQNGFKECSGFCVSEHGIVYSFWFGWDGQQPALTEWDAVTPKDQPWSRTIAYRKARGQVGIGMMLVTPRRRRKARHFVPVR